MWAATATLPDPHTAGPSAGPQRDRKRAACLVEERGREIGEPVGVQRSPQVDRLAAGATKRYAEDGRHVARSCRGTGIYPSAGRSSGLRQRSMPPGYGQRTPQPLGRYTGRDSPRNLRPQPPILGSTRPGPAALVARRPRGRAVRRPHGARPGPRLGIGPVPHLHRERDRGLRVAGRPRHRDLRGARRPGRAGPPGSGLRERGVPDARAWAHDARASSAGR